MQSFLPSVSIFLYHSSRGFRTYYGVSILCDEAPDKQTHDLLEQIYKPMELGATLHSALKDTGYFPKIYDKYDTAG